MVAVLVGGARGNHDNRYTRQLGIGTHGTGQFKTVHARHFDIQQHHVRHAVLQHLQGVEAILGGNYLVTFARQHAASDFAHGQRVIDHHDNFGSGDRRGRRKQHWLMVVLILTQCQLHRVDDEYDLAVTQYGGTGNAADPRQLRADIFHYHLAVASQFIDQNRCALVAASEQNDRVVVLCEMDLFGLSKQMGQVEQRIIMSLPGNFSVRKQLGQCGGFVFLHLVDHGGGQGIQMAARRDQYTLRDGQGER